MLNDPTPTPRELIKDLYAEDYKMNMAHNAVTRAIMKGEDQGETFNQLENEFNTHLEHVRTIRAQIAD